MSSLSSPLSYEIIKEKIEEQKFNPSQALRDEVDVRLKMQGLVNLLVDEDLLEALAACLARDGGNEDDITAALTKFRELWSNALRKESLNGEIDAFVSLRMCAKLFGPVVVDSSTSAHSFTSDSSSESISSDDSTSLYSTTPSPSSSSASDSPSSSTTSDPSFSSEDAHEHTDDSLGEASSLRVDEAANNNRKSSRQSWTMFRRGANKAFRKIVSGRP
ncbi:hypothetical protein D9758_013119 [Tetrapyrgos nigripes]|uniref:Uncharacterized protein n=1 Tax=Tetrapyrgos nigripes TaxID=182062 RepID=A0A8H5FHZ6_9AGAR|nr:hypothetical protein D9758_013119 [Tetrapyrgos nigripes]